MQNFLAMIHKNCHMLLKKFSNSREVFFHSIRKKHYIWVMICCMVLAVFTYGILISPAVSSANDDQLLIMVNPGMTAKDIGELLYDKGLISNVTMFRVIARLDGLESSLQAGEYAFTKDMSMHEIVDRLSAGETVYTLLVIPEGYTVEQIAKLIEEKHIGSAAVFKELARNYKNGYSQSNPAVNYSAEGFIFPATYKVAKGTTEEQLLQQMMVQFNEKFTDEMKNQAQNEGMSVQDVIILASLVEKEAQLPKDRPLIAGVFLNRLKRDMPLQSCATIQYILGYPKAELSVQDTEIPSPYNTYQNKGLPPGPIANPGIEAIKAVLNPAETSYLYFVADKKGAHHFSTTYEEHLENIKQVRD